MDAPQLSADPSPSEPAEGLAEVGTYPNAAEGFSHGLVVLATGRPYWLVPQGDCHRLWVEAEAADEIREQLRRFDRESVGWPPAPAPSSSAGEVDFLLPLGWAVVVLAVFLAERRFPQWIDRGVLDTQAVFSQGQWWRAATALFLHADAAHVLSNVLSGLLVFCALSATLGRWRGTLLLAAAAVGANLAIAAANYPGPYRSLGASTAVFAGVGLLTGRALRTIARSRPAPGPRALGAPLASGLTVLALYGAGEAQVDVGAHLMGFVVGGLFGFFFGISRERLS